MYLPESYWNRRARDLIRTYDSPETWPERGWMRAGVEEQIVPRLLREAEVATVIVPGTASGRQYRYLLDAGFQPWGFDISPRLVKECRRRFPEVTTYVGNVVGADEREEYGADAVVTSGVLQHVPPAEITRAVRSIQTMAHDIVVIRELTRVAASSVYQFAHDYRALFASWPVTYSQVTDETAAGTVELIAWRNPASMAEGEPRHSSSPT